MPKHPLFSTTHENATPIDPLSHEAMTLPTPHKKNKMACLILAGGQGTRLGMSGPKGCVELQLKERVSLFEYLLLKVKDKDLPVALMTSPYNHEETKSFLEKHHFFGLTHVDLFKQGVVPVCDDGGELIYDESGVEIVSPDGNGKAFHYLVQSGLWDKWKKEGVERVQVMLIDNPLATPFDEELNIDGVDLVLKAIKRKSVDEKVGILGVSEGKLRVQEYTEGERDIETYPYGNTGIFSCTLDFVKRASSIDLPWHLARKKSNNQWVTKFEAFIFDLFPYANSFKVVIGDRKKCFAPLKNLSGPDSLESVSNALMTFNH